MLRICRTLLWVSCFFVAAISGSAAEAQTSVPSTAQPGIVLRQLEKGLEKAPAGEAIIVIPPMEETTEGASTEKAFVLNNIVIDGATLYSANDFEPAYQDFIGQKVSFADLLQIASRLTKKYREDGYVFSRVIVPAQKLQDGVVHLQAIEGHIAEIEINGDYTDKGGVIRDMAEKIRQAGPINANTLERYLLLMNDLPGITAHGVLRPSKEPDAADLVVTIEQSNFGGSVTGDDRGSRFLGPYRGSVVLDGNSLIGYQDRTTLRSIVTPGHELKFVDVTHQEYVGSEGLRIEGRFALTDTRPGGRIKDLNIQGESLLFELNALYPLLRGRELNFSLTGGMSALNSQTDVLDIRTATDRVRSMHVGGHFDATDAWRGVTLADIDVIKGLPTFDATPDGDGRSRVNAVRDFTRTTATATRIQSLWDNWSLMTSATGQYSGDALLSSEQFTIGGGTYGRAYDAGELAGDAGMAGVAELRYGQPVKDFFLTSWQAYTFYDIGKVYNLKPVVGEKSEDSGASTGVGVRFDLMYDFFGSAEYARALSHSINAEDGRKSRIFVSLSKKF